MNVRTLFLPLLAALALSLTTAQSLAERSPRPRPALSPVAGEVIVKFKADAPTTRRFALTARSDAATVQSRLASRTAALGSRTGRALQSGAAVDERTQVMRATGVDSATLARQLAADPEVEYAVPNGRKRATTAPNDTYYLKGPNVSLVNLTGGPDSGQWYLRAPDATVRSSIDIEAAWARTTGTATTVVAVLDSGVRFEHPDLGRATAGGPLLAGYDFVANAEVGNDGDGRDADPADPGDWTTAAENSNVNGTFYQCDPEGVGDSVPTSSSWHGTATASLVAARTNNSLGMASAAPGVKVLPVRVLGKCFGYDSDIIAAMRWSAGLPVPGVPANPNPAKVINMSLGGSGSCSVAYQDAVTEILARNVSIVAAAGNSAGQPVGTPANCDGVIGVLALRHAGTKVGFSSLGPEVAIAAPGGNCVNVGANEPCLYPIIVASNAGAREPASSTWTDAFNPTVGTSFSSPLVAGVAGLMVSANPSITTAQLRTALRNTARPFPTSGADNTVGDPPVAQCTAPTTSGTQYQCYCNTQYCGAGMLDAGAAVAAAAALPGPVARIDVSPAAPTAGVAVVLSADNSTVVNGATIKSYAWTLTNGGGIVSSFDTATNAHTATLTPTAAGSFTVQLTITDSAGASVSASQTVVVAAPVVLAPPVPRIQLITTSPTAGNAVTLNGNASTVDSGTTLKSYAWSLIDGGGIVSGFSSPTNASSASLTPMAAGSFTVQLTVTDATGKSASATQTVVVAAVPVPVVRIVLSTASPVAGSAVTLSGGTSTVASGATLQSYTWTLLDGGGIVTGFSTATNAESVTLTPTAAGSFTVQLTVADSLGATASNNLAVAVAAAPVTPPPTSGGGGGGGGGAASLWWVMGVLTAALALLQDQWRRSRAAARAATAVKRRA